jgi:hypothetical protein
MPGADKTGNQLLSKDPPDIEVNRYILLNLFFVNLYIQSLLALNPKTNRFANSRPSSQTLKDKKHWKRNDEHTCASVCV